MKGIVMGIGMLALSIGVSLGLMFYVSHETLRTETVFALKQALQETMIKLDQMDPGSREDQALTVFAQNFAVRKKSGVTYTADLMGFHDEPLALRIRLTAHDTVSLFGINIIAEETMIEVTHENQ